MGGRRRHRRCSPTPTRRRARWFQRMARASVSPAGARDLILMNSKADVRDLLPSVQCPTLVFHRAGDRDSNVEEGRFIAERIPGARFVELPGDTHVPWVDDDQMLDDVEEFLTGTRRAPTSDRLLRPCSSPTSSARRIGSRRWETPPGRQLLDRHHAAVRARARALRRRRGRTRRATASWRCSTARRARSGPVSRSATRCEGSGSTSGSASTPARSSRRPTALAGSPFTSPPGCSPPPAPARCSSRRRPTTSSRDRGSSSRTEGSTS